MSGGKRGDVYMLARMLHIRHDALLVIPSLTCSANWTEGSGVRRVSCKFVLESHCSECTARRMKLVIRMKIYITDYWNGLSVCMCLMSNC